MSENKFDKLPYTPWLEEALRELITFPVKGICMFAVAENGAVYSNYHEVSMMDKITIAGLIQQDAMTDSLIANHYIEPDEGE